MSDGFLGRWAKRKEAVRKGEAVADAPEQEERAVAPPPALASPRGGGSEYPVAEERGEGRPAAEPPPTLEDVQSLAPGADVSRFVRADVAPEVKNAALKKLFADPHFNAMDGLDVYIDDYNKADPLPPEMLRKLASAQFLKLFDEPPEKPPEPAGAAGEGAQTVAQSDVCNDLPTSAAASAQPPAGTAHADPDLRLQQDDAPGPAGPGAGAG